MRLIDTSTLEPKDFISDTVPPYAILSHTWGEQEVSYNDFPNPESRSLAGFKKVEACCALALFEGWSYVWIDTCCIDKKSSAELSEAINSMYRWYAEAGVCYAHLADVSTTASIGEEHSSKLFWQSFRDSRWFTRGWTLQELLAPSSLTFYDQDWNYVGRRDALKADISRAAKISIQHLNNHRYASIAQKMSWASHRKTSRKEDTAYCLLGIFEINMPLLYGEGSKAFARLQHEIIRVSVDQSIFAWRNQDLWSCGMFALSPADFSDSSDIVSIALPRDYGAQKLFSLNALGLDIELAAQKEAKDDLYETVPGFRSVRTKYIAPIACAKSSEPGRPLLLTLKGSSSRFDAPVALRTNVDTLVFADWKGSPQQRLKKFSERKRFFVEEVVSTKSIGMQQFLITGQYPTIPSDGMAKPILIPSIFSISSPVELRAPMEGNPSPKSEPIVPQFLFRLSSTVALHTVTLVHDIHNLSVANLLPPGSSLQEGISSQTSIRGAVLNSKGSHHIDFHESSSALVFVNTRPLVNARQSDPAFALTWRIVEDEIRLLVHFQFSKGILGTLWRGLSGGTLDDDLAATMSHGDTFPVSRGNGQFLWFKLRRGSDIGERKRMIVDIDISQVENATVFTPV